MRNVRVVLKEGQEKIYFRATATIQQGEHLLFIKQGTEVVAQYQPEYYQYWEYIEESKTN